MPGAFCLNAGLRGTMTVDFALSLSPYSHTATPSLALGNGTRNAHMYGYAQGRMSIHVYCVLVVRAWTYEYGLNQMYVGGFSTGNRPPVFPP